MTRFAILFSVFLVALGLTYPFARRHGAAVRAADDKSVFLIRFGEDGRADTDWSGSISCQGCRIWGWQFDRQDQISGLAWKCATRAETYWDTPYEASMGPTANREKVTGKGIFVELSDQRPVQVSTSQGSFTLEPRLAPGDPPRSYLDGKATVAAVPPAAHVTAGANAEDYPSLLYAKDGTLWMAYLSYEAGKGDQVFVRRLSGGAWSAPDALGDAGGDYFRTAIAQDRDGRVWVVWSAQESSNFDLYARSYDGKKWSAKQKLTAAEGSDIFHALVSDASGNLYLAWQSARAGNFDIYLRVYDGKKWSREVQVSSDPANDWEPALAVAPNGKVTILWDTFARGNYDVVARTWEKGQLGPASVIAGSGAFESRVVGQYDGQGRLWIAWDEGDWNWGKDYGNGVRDNGRGLMVRRQVRVAVLDNGRLLETASPIAGSVPEDFRQAFQRPTLALDGPGNPWVFYRYRVNLPRLQGRGSYRGMWRLAGTTYRNGRWSPMMEFPEGSGRQDVQAAAVACRAGNLAVVWVSEGREWPLGRPQQQDLRFAAIPPGPASARPELVAFVPSSENLAASHPLEVVDIARVRSYRTRVGAATMQVVRGDLHRHTDLSWDGNRDGTLDDSYRYAMDAAGLDYLGVCDHQAGESIPYHWWRIQKAVDLYTIKDRFAPLYSYERSLAWPNGHRNVFFDRRGRPVLEIPERESRGEEGAGKLYEYLRKFDGVTSSHTSATGAGTDWRDSDPEVEPVVEIYQGYRNNYETAGAPRSAAGKEAERYRAGFVWNAWAKGIKIGVQSSSDHVSTHMSYAGFFVDRVNREAILAAIKARRSYAATDNLMVEIRMGDRFMGESFSAAAPLPLTVYASGTGSIARVELIKSNRIVYTVPGGGAEVRFTYTDQDVQPGEAYYYVRVQQADGQLCWSSPIWVRY
jgi:hypothetical protein